jgi:hypothetical protein
MEPRAGEATVEQGRKDFGVGMLDQELGLWMGFPKEPI